MVLAEPQLDILQSVLGNSCLDMNLTACPRRFFGDLDLSLFRLLQRGFLGLLSNRLGLLLFLASVSVFAGIIGFGLRFGIRLGRFGHVLPSLFSVLVVVGLPDPLELLDLLRVVVVLLLLLSVRHNDSKSNYYKGVNQGELKLTRPFCPRHLPSLTRWNHFKFTPGSCSSGMVVV